jgi:hypothetical protein
MQIAGMTKRLALPLICCGLLWQPLQAADEDRDKGRAGLDDLSHEMSTCAAYFSLMSSIIKNSGGPKTKAKVADRIKLTGQAMLTQAINVARYIGEDEKVPMERVQVRLKEMVETINSDPLNSLAAMHTKYGQPCDVLLVNAPRRFVELLKQYEAE